MLKKSLVILMVIGTFMISSLAFAEEDASSYPVPMANRPLTLDKGMGEVGLDVMLGLNSGRAAKDIGLGLSFGYGLTDTFELGVDVLALNYGKDAQGLKFGGAAVYMTWDFLGFLGLYADIHFPGYTVGGNTYVDSFGDQLVGVTVGLPATYTIINDTLKIHGGLLIDVGFAKEAYATQSLQMALDVELGVTLSLIERLFIDLTFDAIMAFRPDAGSFGDRTAIPLELTVGYTVIDPMDIYLGFALSDLNGDGIDSRMLTLGANFRF